MFKIVPIDRIMLAIISGIFLAISLPKIGLWWFTWFALLPLFVALRGVSIKDAFQIGTIAGIVHFFVVINWLVFVLKIYAQMQWWQCLFLFFMFLLYLSFYLASFSVIISLLVNKPYEFLIVAPTSWILLEFARGSLFTGFPWEFIGYSQFEQIYIIQIADIFGIYGISFLIVISNAAIYVLILFLFNQDWKGHQVNIKILFICCFSVLILIISSIYYGHWRIHNIEQQVDNACHVKIGIVQGNIDQSIKWDPVFQINTTKKYINLSTLLSLEKPDLIVWPETATPFHFGCSPELTDFVIEAVKNIKSDFIIGSPSILADAVNNINSYYNSAYLIDGSDGKIKAKYDKSQLVPFGEYLPLRWLTQFFVDHLIQPHDFKSGVPGNVILWEVKQVHLGLQICYEIIFPKLSRLMTKNEANLLINLANDAWFGNSSASYQHFSMSIFRSIENRRSLIRATNTGISAFIDPVGKILAQTNICDDAILVKEVPILYLKTIYTRFGDLFILMCLCVFSCFFFKYFFN